MTFDIGDKRGLAPNGREGGIGDERSELEVVNSEMIPGQLRDGKLAMGCAFDGFAVVQPLEFPRGGVRKNEFELDRFIQMSFYRFWLLIDTRGQAGLSRDGDDFGLRIERGDEVDRTDLMLWVWIVPRENPAVGIGLDEFDGGTIRVMETRSKRCLGLGGEDVNTVAMLVDWEGLGGLRCVWGLCRLSASETTPR